jgi:hypothetical protein
MALLTANDKNVRARKFELIRSRTEAKKLAEVINNKQTVNHLVLNHYKQIVKLISISADPRQIDGS